jgi:orotate phosphoribosyltransferase
MTDPELIALARDIDATCRLTGEFVLRSGQVTDEYFDKYLFETEPTLLRRVVERMVALVPGRVDLLGGLELGGVPLVTMLSSVTGIPALFVRKEAKTYGTRRLAEGASADGRVIVLVEDVITTGGAVRNAARALRAGGATVDTVICAIDRSEPGTDPFATDRIAIRAVLTKDLLDLVTSRDGNGLVTPPGVRLGPRP